MIDLKQSINSNEEEKILNDHLSEDLIENQENLKDNLNSEQNLISKKNKNDTQHVRKRRSTFKARIYSFFSYFKDYLLTLLLLGSSLYNFAIPNIPYTIAGIIFLFLILKESNFAIKTKAAIVLVILIINIANLAFKIFIVTAENMEWFNISELLINHKNLFLNLGIRYLEAKDFHMYANTFAGEVILLIGLVVYLVMGYLEKRKAEDGIYHRKLTKIKYEDYSNIFMCLISLLTLGTTCINHSFLSIFMSILVHLGLLLWSLNKTTNYHKVIYYILCVILISTILATHIFNIYDLRQLFLYEKSDNKILRWIGIKKMKRKIDYFFYIIMLVLSASLCMVAIRLNNHQTKNRKGTKDSLKSENTNENENTIWTKIKETTINYIYSPYFSLHFCRLAIIYWVYSFNNFPTIGLLSWLIYSFLILNAWKLRFVTFFIALPCLYLQYYMFMISNMKGFMELFIDFTDANRLTFAQFCIKAFDSPVTNFCCIQTTILLFAIFLKTNVPPTNIEKRKWNNSIILGGMSENLLDKANNKNSITESNSQQVSFKVLIAKLIITNIDKITLIFMYVIAIQKVGIAHFILTIIFLIQMILPSAIKKLCFLIILTILLIFSLEYIWDLVKIHVPLTESLINFINLFIEFNGTDIKIDCVEFVLPFIVYCFYIQYQNYNSTVYQIYQNRSITFQNYLEQLLQNHKKLENFILFAIGCIQEIYVWIILILLFMCVCVFNYYVAFGFKLFFFFLVMYKFLTLSKNSRKAQNIFKYIWILIIYCGVNTMFIYFYQFTELKFIQPWYKNLEDKYPLWLKENMTTFGFEKYTDNLTLKFLPHYGSNFLSVLLLWEIKRIFQIKTEFRESQKDVDVNNPNRNLSNNPNVLSCTEKIEIDVLQRKDSKRFDKSSDFSFNTKQNNTQDVSEVQKINYIKFYLFQFLIFFCKTYWLLIFLSISAFIVNYQMSLGMIFYIIIFSFSFNFIFKNIIKSMSTFMNKNNKFYLSRLIRFSMVENPRNIIIQRKNRKLTFKYLLVCGMMYISLTYFYILFDIIQNGNNEKREIYPIVSEAVEEYIKSIAYILGVFYSNTREGNFVGGIWGHILMILLISLDIYIQKAQNFMTASVGEEKRKMRINAKIKREEFLASKKSLKASEENEKNSNENKMKPIEESFRSAKSFSEAYDNIDEKSSLKNEESNEIFSKVELKEKSQNMENSQNLQISQKMQNNNIDKNMNTLIFISVFDKKNEINQPDNIESTNVRDIPIIAQFLQIFENYKKSFTSKKLADLDLHDKNLSMAYIIATKKVLEEFIIFMILLSAILKLNVISIIYIIVVIILQSKNRNVKTIYHTTIFMCISIIFQSLVFLSNLNEHTDPNPNLEILKIINNRLYIPWYPEVLDNSWAFYLNLGVNSYQINILWIEFIIVITSFIYLDNFSYSIYDQESQMKKKINYLNILKKQSIRNALTDINQEDYEILRNNLSYNFEMDLIEFQELKLKYANELKKEDDDLSSVNSLRKDKIEHKKQNRESMILAEKLKNFTFLAMHNFILLLTIILSMMNSGLISVIYIIFSLYYLFTSSHLLLGKIYSFPKAIKNFLRVFFICDLFIQLLYQNPLNVYLIKYDYILNSIGINKTIDYTNGPDQNLFNTKSAIIDCTKAATYLLISLQILIYSSSDFKEFYLNYIFKKKQIYFKNSLLNSFLFNNKKIKMMEKIAANRKQINNVLKELEGQLQMWDAKLSNDRGNNLIEDNKSKNIFASYDSADKIQAVNLNSENSNEDVIIKEYIKDKIKSSFLIKFAMYIHRNTTSYSFIDKKYKKELEIEIVKGETYIKSGLEKRIEEFIRELKLDEIKKDEYLKQEKEFIDENFKEFKDNNFENTIITSNNINRNKTQSKDINQKNLSPINKMDELKLKEKFEKVLFKSYITTYYMLYFLFISIIKYFFHNFQYICYFCMIFNNIMYASLLSLFWPFVVFGYALIEYPRPKNKFWKFCLQYASIVLVLKFIIQFNLVKNVPALMNAIETLDHYKIGLRVFSSSYSIEFLFYIIFDVILILFMLLQEYFLIDRGIWEETEPEIESIEEANDRVNKAKAIDNEEIHNYTKLLLSQSNSVYAFNKKKLIDTNQSSLFNIHKRVFPTIRNYKPGDDFYAYYTTIEMLIMLYVIIFYTDMDQDNMFQTQGKATVRQFSGTMVLVAFFVTIKIIIDRVIYLQNRNNLKFEWVYYDKNSGDKLSQEKLDEMGIKSPEDAEKYEHISSIYYQIEPTNYAAICKYVLQIVILILSHIFIFFFLTMIGNFNLQNSIYCESKDICNDFSSNTYLIIFYILYCLYLFYSALQIQYGLLEMRKKSLFVRGDNIIYSSLFKCCKAIPFLDELKLTIDWTFTPTCLDLFKWLKFESVYDLLFVTHCTKKAEKKLPIGKNINVFQKLMMGGSSFVILLGILIGPLLIFSTLNPANIQNNVTGANIQLSICFQHNEKVFNNFTLFKNEYVESIIDMNMEKEIWKAYGYNNSSKTKNFPMRQVQIINMSDTSDTIWDIAGPHIDTIKERLENYEDNEFNITFGFEYSFSRLFPPDAKDSVKRFDYPLYITSKVNQKQIIKQLLDNIKNCNKTEIVLLGFYYPAVRLSSASHPKLIISENSQKIDVIMNLMCEESNGKVDYTKSYFTIKKSDTRDPHPGITFHTFSDKVSQTSASYDVMTFYISSILVIGRLIRGALSGEAEKIVLTEMPEPKNLINLCEGIKISRYRYEFEREEHLYFVLIDFMRSPEILKLLTKSSIKSLQERKELNNNKY